MTITDKELREMKERANAASKAPWLHWWCGDEMCDCHAVQFPDNDSGVEKKRIDKKHEGYDCSQLWTGSDGEGGWSNACPDAEFISHSREDVPRLITELEKVRGLLESQQGHHAQTCEIWVTGGAECNCANKPVRTYLKEAKGNDGT